MEGMIGEIRMFAGNFAPRSWAFCEGQLMAISGNSALFSILGTTYGGDGRTTYGLPDLRGRSPIGPGNGPGLTARRLGQKGGAEYNSLTVAQLPAHSHSSAIHAGSVPTSNDPSSAYPAEVSGRVSSPPALITASTYGTLTDLTMKSEMVQVANAGGGQQMSNMQPSLAMYYIICLVGLYPSRS